MRNYKQLISKRVVKSHNFLSLSIFEAKSFIRRFEPMLMRHLFTLFFILSAVFCFAQDTLVMIDRAPKVGTFSRIEGEYVIYKKRNREKSIEIDKVFSIRSPGLDEKIIYRLDTLEGNIYSISEMKDYIQGQQDARKGFRKKSKYIGMGGFVAGAVGSMGGLLYGPVSILAYTGLVGYSKPKLREKRGFNPDMIASPPYIDGYSTMAKRYSTRAAFVGSTVGYVTGIFALSIFFAQP